jgi:hypothetical protein
MYFSQLISNDCQLPRCQLCAINAILMQFELVPLPELDQRFQTLSQRMQSLKQEGSLIFMKPFLQTIHNLMGLGAGDAGTFSGPIFFDDQVDMFKHALPTAYGFCFYFKALLQYVLGDSEETQKLVHELYCVNRRANFDSVVMVSLLLLLEGLCVISLARASNRQRVTRAKHCSNYLKQLTMREPYSHLGKHMILEAELAGLKRGQDIGLLPKYVLAISATKESGSLFMYALANELTAKYLLRQKLNTKADRYIRESIRSYDQWGATAKAGQLRNELNIIGNVSI